MTSPIQEPRLLNLAQDFHDFVYQQFRRASLQVMPQIASRIGMDLYRIMTEPFRVYEGVGVQMYCRNWSVGRARVEHA